MYLCTCYVNSRLIDVDVKCEYKTWMIVVNFFRIQLRYHQPSIRDTCKTVVLV